MKRLLIAFTAALVVSGCQTTDVTPVLVTSLDGAVLDVKNIPAFNQGGKVETWLNTQLRNKFAIAMQSPTYCPKYKWRSKNEATIVETCSKGLNKKHPELDEYVEGGCSCVQVVDKEGRLLVPTDSLSSPSMHTVYNLLIETTSGERSFDRGVMQYEFKDPVLQDVILKNKKGEEFCKGTVEYSYIREGKFDLSCFEGSRHAKGITELTVGSGRTHAIGSGVFDNGDKFIFVTRFSGEQLRKEYPEYFANMK